MFPLICGEKGLCGITVSTKPIKASDSAFVEYWAGEAFNAIPSEAYVVVRYNVQDLPEAANIEFRKAGMDDEGRLLSMIIAHGVGGHAAFPTGTVNAIEILANYLLDNHIVEGAEADLLRFQAELTSDWKGTALGVACSDDIFGDLTIIGGTVRSVFEGDMVRFEQTMDSRYPMATTADEIADKIGAFAARYGLVVRETHAKKPFYIEPESPEIEACLSSYQEVYGRTDMPVTIGGGTYARRFPRAVAFGPLDEELETPDWVGPEHGANEGANEEMLKKSLVIYILALARLMRLDF
jgi:succinyl-diaminopimelate desuccinylase